MSRKPQAPVQEEKGECAPLWIISFADMISLLMAFFVMLLTMSTAKSGKLCNEGEGIFEKTLYGFRQSIEGFGMPGLFGDARDGVYLDSSKVYYPISGENDGEVTRTIDARGERVRQAFGRLQERTRTYESQVRGRNPDFVVLPITFSKGQSALSESAKEFLGAYATEMKGYGPVEGVQIYVVGLAPDEPDQKQQWLLSAKRAQAVAAFLRDQLPSGTDSRVFSWGAATGGDWVKKDSPISQQSQMAIAMLRPDK